MKKIAFRFIFEWIAAPLLAWGEFTPLKSAILDRLQIWAGFIGR